MKCTAFKTGTPARIDGSTIDYDKMEEQFGDEKVVPFSFTTDPEDVQIDQVSCYLTYTNEKTHEIVHCKSRSFANVFRCDRGHRSEILPFHRGQGRKIC